MYFSYCCSLCCCLVKDGNRGYIITPPKSWRLEEDRRRFKDRLFRTHPPCSYIFYTCQDPFAELSAMLSAIRINLTSLISSSYWLCVPAIFLKHWSTFIKRISVFTKQLNLFSTDLIILQIFRKIQETSYQLENKMLLLL